MKRFMRPSALIAVVFLAAAVAAVATDPAPENAATLVKVTGGVATFDSTTNMPGIGVKGKSNSMSGEVSVIHTAEGLSLQSINATVPVTTLATGMKMRDEHMRKLIFATSSGDAPDLQFRAEAASCGQHGSGREFTCSLTGNLQIRGIDRPVVVALKVKEQSSDPESFKVDGDGLVKLSDYGITPPTQLGVSLANEVKFHLELQAKAGAQ